MLHGDWDCPRVFVKEIVGIGRFGVVYRGQKRYSLSTEGEIVAVKQIKIDWNSDAEYLQSVIREVRILSQIKHTNILGGHHVSDDGAFIHVVTAFCCSNLLKIIESSKAYKKTFTDTRMLLWTISQLFSGLNYLHKCNLVHRCRLFQTFFKYS